MNDSEPALAGLLGATDVTVAGAWATSTGAGAGIGDGDGDAVALGGSGVTTGTTATTGGRAEEAAGGGVTGVDRTGGNGASASAASIAASSAREVVDVSFDDLAGFGGGMADFEGGGVAEDRRLEAPGFSPGMQPISSTRSPSGVFGH
jgi:hypothetical protein